MRIEPHDYHALASATPSIAEEVGQLAATASAARAACRASPPSPSRPRAIVLGHRWDGDCAELRRFLDRNQITFRWLQPDVPDEAAQWWRRPAGRRRLPRIRVVNGKTVVRPQLRRVAELLEVADRAGRGGVRHGDRRRRPRRPGGRRVRRVGGPADDRRRARGARRPGRAPPRGSRTTSASRPASPATSWPAARSQQARRLGAEILVTRSITRIDAATAPGPPRRRRRPARTDDHPRLRRVVAAARDRGLRPPRREGHLLRRRAQRGAEHARARRPRHRRRQLGRPGRDVLLARTRGASPSSTAATRSRRACRAT